MNKELIRLKNIRVQKDGYSILKNINLTISAGEISGIYGLYDSGKGTLTDILTGQLLPDEGIIFYHETPVKDTQWTSRTARLTGENMLTDSMVLWESVMAQQKTRGGKALLPRGFLKKEMQQRLNDFGLSLNAGQMTSSLTILQKRMLEILKAWLLHKELIIVDMLPPAISPQQYSAFYSFLERIAKRGAAILITGSNIKTLEQCTRNIHFLYEGIIIKSSPPGPKSDCIFDSLIRQSLGHIPDTVRFPSTDTCTTPKQIYPIAVRDFPADGDSGTCFQLSSGYVTALVDTSNIVCTSIEQSIYGRPVKNGRRLLLNGNPLDILQKNLGAAWADFETSDKIIPGLSPLENICLNLHGRLAPLGYMKHSRRRAIINEFNSWYGSTELMNKTSCNGISKREVTALLLFRLRLIKPRLLFCRDFTSSADYAAVNLIKKELREMAHRGAAICILVSNTEKLKEFADKYIILQQP